MARKESTKQKNEAIPTIIGAGITEKWYFTHLQAKYRVHMKIRPRFFGKETIFLVSATAALGLPHQLQPRSQRASWTS